MSDVARWWDARGYSVEDEKSRFEGSELDFSLDERLFEEEETVVFRGRLRYGSKRLDATILYPAGYAAGEQPSIYAPDLPLDDHKRPSDGLICLDQSVFGEKMPLTGAEAVQSAEELWRLSVEDPEKLRELSPVTPEPLAAWFVFEENSAAYLLDVEVPNAKEGWLRLDLQAVTPTRGALGAWGLGLKGDGGALDVPSANSNFKGGESVPGFWRRVEEFPRIFSAEEILAWARAEHADLIAHAKAVEQAHGALTGRLRSVMLAFVFPDRGPAWDETHDAWVILRIDQDGTPALPRTIELDRDGFWVRQPQLRPLSERKVVVLGVGALGSQIAELLARAGVGSFMLIDPDRVSAGNTNRHVLHLGHVGFLKAQALQIEMSRVNPFAKIDSIAWQFGASTSGAPASATDAAADRKLDELVAEQLLSADLIVEASTVSATGFLVSRLADRAEVPVLHASVSAGGWGGRLLVQRHGSSGCLECLARHQEDGDGVVPPWTENPTENPVVEKGCGQTTFTGPGFELTSTASAAARLGVQALLEGDGYPELDFDLATWEFRSVSTAKPSSTYTKLPRHPSCDSCTT